MISFIAQSLDSTQIQNILQDTHSIREEICAPFFDRGFWPIVIDIATLFAAVAAIFAITAFLIDLRKRRISREFQARVLEDIERYLYGNDIFIEVIRLKMEKVGWNPDCTLLANVLRRFSFPDIDLDLGKFSVSAKNYDILHEFILQLRNYNISAQVTAEHFENKCDKLVRINDLIDLQYRSESLFRRINEDGKGLKYILDLPMRSVYEVGMLHHGHFEKDNLKLNKQQKTIKKEIESIFIPETYKDAGLTQHYRKAVADRYFWFYDIEILPLPEGFNDKIYHKRPKYRPTKKEGDGNKTN